MLKTDNFFVQFEIDNVLFTETFRLAYRTEEYKKYWLDGILDKSHCHYQQAQREAAKALGERKRCIKIVTLFKTVEG